MILSSHGIIGSQIVQFSGLLDTYTGAAAAYSLRLLSTSYTGSAIKVRRASDNTEQDIGFSNNVLDTTTLASFCSGTDGFVTTWYDQSGNGNNATQTTAANQPQIVSGGSVVLDNGKPTITLTTQEMQLNFSIDRSSGVFSVAFVGQQIYNRSVVFSDGGTGYVLFGRSSNTSSAFGDLSSVSLYVDGVASSITTAGDAYTALFGNQSLVSVFASHSWTTNNLMIGFQSTATGMYQTQELIIYTNDQSTNRSGIETNINNFYSIY